MCGIAGIVSSSKDLDIAKTANLMAQEIINRGPDSHGLFSTNIYKNNIAITHRRLSILDLSEKGNQPMTSKNKRFVIAFNGEIYNHKFIKRKIDNIKEVQWEGNSDTEILLESISIFGIRKTLNIAVGMFAISLLDKQEEILYLLRDRFGEKPLYYGLIGNSSNKSLVFASEIHALKKIPFFKKEIDPLSFEYFLRLSYIPTPLSIYKDIFKVRPASMIIFNLKEDLNKPKKISWWSHINLVKKNSDRKYNNEEDALNALDLSLDQSITDQSISDVPLGCFLSGGVDSSIITAKLQSQNKNKIKTFTIGFNNKEFDESKYAKKIANYLGTDHHEFIINPDDIFKIINDLPAIYSEPFADSSQIPTALICREIKDSGITVALSGDGGEEIFGGYVRHYMINNLWNKINLLPFSLRKQIGTYLTSLPNQLWNDINILNRQNLGEKISKFNQSLKNSQTKESLYKSLVIDNAFEELYSNEFKKLLGLNSSKNKFSIFPPIEKSNKIDFVDKMLLWDASLYLTDDILVKVDRASMHYSLETRAPFLDARLVEVASKIPYSLKVKKNYGKHILRKLLYKYIPKQYFERPKSGFALPIGEWLRSDLKDWAENFIYEKDPYINQKNLEKIWEQHISYQNDHKIILWRIIMWRAWLSKNKVF